MTPEENLTDLRVEARRAMEAAYAPYSGFRVGAAIQTADGRIHAGCNVENASFSVTMCAERVAIGAAIASGDRSFRRVFICSTSVEPVPPCGVCCQALSEFGPDLEVISEGLGGLARTWTLRQLLPDQFRLEERDSSRHESTSPETERPT